MARGVPLHHARVRGLLRDGVRGAALRLRRDGADQPAERGDPSASHSRTPESLQASSSFRCFCSLPAQTTASARDSGRLSPWAWVGAPMISASTSAGRRSACPTGIRLTGRCRRMPSAIASAMRRVLPNIDSYTIAIATVGRWRENSSSNCTFRSGRVVGGVHSVASLHSIGLGEEASGRRSRVLVSRSMGLSARRSDAGAI